MCLPPTAAALGEPARDPAEAEATAPSKRVDLPASHRAAADAPATLRERAAGVAATLVLWPLILLLPLALNRTYPSVWPEAWYTHDPTGSPSPLGLSLGLGAVAVGQVFVLAYQWLRWNGSEATGRLEPVQPNEYRTYAYGEAAAEHLSQPEGFALIGGYLVVTWMLKLMPDSYYSFEGGIEWGKVAACLLIQDLLQYGMHRAEHRVSKAFYRASHEPHHRFTNPRLFDAFNGSFCDTLFMIVIPLFITKSLVHCNVWSYMAFGSSYANWLCLIHSETHHPWDPLFYKLGFGTAADHHVHHKLFAYNFGHLFLYWDQVLGTYRDPRKVRQFKANGGPPVAWKPHTGTAKDK
mmetsp:Transcript_18443/g.56771  ORF Transcript_18443/g.56771 Transcript_18443/m.56771 type:complete len:351 (+) Transcript_18443:210-1262(+)